MSRTGNELGSCPVCLAFSLLNLLTLALINAGLAWLGRIEKSVFIELSEGIQTGNEPGALRTTDVCRDHHHSLHIITGRFGKG